jgi:hypothetical protein
VYAVSKGTKTITVLGPKFVREAFGAHQAHMSVRRDRLVFRAGAEGQSPALTTVRPAFKMLTDAGLEQAEVFVWDLAGLKISYPVSGEVTLNGSELLADLRELETLAGRPEPTLGQAALQTGPAGTANTLVEVTAGVGTATRVITTAGAYRFVTETDALDNDPDNDVEVADGTGKPVEKPLADIVEFVVAVPAGQTRLTLTLSHANGQAVGIVSVREGTTVSFSNLCTPIPRRHLYDLEFSQYYDLLANPPATGDRLVPKAPPVPTLAEGVDCYVQAQIERKE